MFHSYFQHREGQPPRDPVHVVGCYTVSDMILSWLQCREVVSPWLVEETSNKKVEV